MVLKEGCRGLAAAPGEEELHEGPEVAVVHDAVTVDVGDTIGPRDRVPHETGPCVRQNTGSRGRGRKPTI